MCITCVSGAYEGQKRISESLELEFTDSCEFLCGCWKSNMGPLKSRVGSKWLWFMFSMSCSYGSLELQTSRAARPLSPLNGCWCLIEFVNYKSSVMSLSPESQKWGPL